MGLLFEKERRTAKIKDLPEIKEVETIRQVDLIIKPARERDLEDFTEEWDELDLFEDEIVDESAETEESDEEAF